MLAQWCQDHDAQFIHIGSGCIFNGPSPHVYCECPDTALECIPVDDGWRETDAPNPVSYYSNTKAACDLVIGSFANTCILRIRMPISSQIGPRNFISKIRGYKQLIDIPNSVTFLDDLVKCVDWVVKGHKTGIYNVINPGPLTAAQVMREYQKYRPGHQFSVMTGEQLDQVTSARRSNCILDGSKLADEGFMMTHSLVALENCMKQYIHNLELNEQ